MIIVDQISVLVSKLRKWNNQLDDFNKARLKGSVSVDELENYNNAKDSFLKPSQNTQALLAKYKRLSPLYILNSSF
jgi:hypothetical protein